ncbi:mitochondrial carrier domain-containing protein [Dipodascopsis tothii]|uniref:mitochondrial carrier domain-containing protein n=1 Tax=Dipodascopsis tothii TaxID=44089 RepID=UPI0034CDAD86
MMSMDTTTAGPTATVRPTVVNATVPKSSPAYQAFAAHARSRATVDGEDEPVMVLADFIAAIAPATEDYHKIPRESYAVLFSVADRQQRGVVSFQDWQTFDALLQKPDAEYEIAFRLFDSAGKGAVEYDEFVKYYNTCKATTSIPFDWNCDWVTLYLGDNKSRHAMTYEQFAQMLKGLRGERVRQAFHYFDRAHTGFIEPTEFQRIIEETAQHKLSDRLLSSLQTLCSISTSSKISYATVRAFENVIREMDTVDGIVSRACAKSSDGRISKVDFTIEAARTLRATQFTPMEVEILFHFAGLDAQGGRLSLDDFRRVLDPSWQDPVTVWEQAEQEKIASAKNALKDPSSFLTQVFESVYHFALGSVAGAFGATIVYPIDLVKTRMQNQRGQVPGQLLYKNSIDCFRKVIKGEGVRGLYSGLGPQLVGVAPEKAIKLTVNDFARGKLADANGNLTLPYEILAGGSAGACQVVFTNPLEIVKIRLQIQGEVSKSIDGAPRRSALWIVRNLGLVGLYKGATACLMRDVPFSAIYFPAYAHLKKDYFGEGPNKPLGIPQLLMAGAIAGMPAAYLTTPCDVIKTRLQAEARAGQTHYKNIAHCASTILREEGFKAFFKGGPARIFRSSPQFGCTLAAYEFLQAALPMNLGGGKTEAGHSVPSGAPPTRPAESRDVRYLRSRNALKILLDIDQDFAKPKLPTAEQWKLVPGLKN